MGHCAQIVPVGSGDFGDSADCRINNLRGLNTWLRFDPPPGTIDKVSENQALNGLEKGVFQYVPRIVFPASLKSEPSTPRQFV